MKEQESNSGFTEHLDQEVIDSSSSPIENAYSNLQEFYVSQSGHTRLFTATRYGKRYILKCLKKDFLYTPVYQQALTKEFEIGLELEHPNICRTIALEQIPTLGSTIVMEQIDGDTLKSLIDKKALTAELSQRIIHQLMDALEYMHNKQIIHRDLKPSNIMVTHRGKNVKIIDFGLSDSDAFFILKLPAGTTGYIAPEQFLPHAQAEPRTDIYSLGKVMEDMAKATGDKKLEKMAEVCILHNPKLRPASIEKLRNYPFKSSHERKIVILLSCLVFILMIVIGLSYLHRKTSSSDGEFLLKTPNIINKDDSPGQIHSEDSSNQNENKVQDYQLWDK